MAESQQERPGDNISEVNPSANAQTENRAVRRNRRQRRTNISRNPHILSRVASLLNHDGNQSKIANLLSFSMFAITTIVAWFTYALYEQTIRANDTTNKALSHQISKDSADNVLRIHKDSIDSISQRRTDLLEEIKSKHDDSVFNYQKRAVDAQIASIKETQKEFELESRPFIQIFNVNVAPIEPNKKVNITFSVANIGKFPAYILSDKSGVAYSTKEDPKIIFKEFDSQWQIKGYEGIASQNSLLNGGGETLDELTEKRYNEIISGYKAIFLYGKIEYSSSLTHKRYLYTFEFKIGYQPKEFKTVVNTDIEIK